ncbi:hypothetical protein SO3561_03711 [Streptomyces olivochromogenes]|uniref:Uncharacterized protein n=1 Tax=Streptomyces olivochromogenes TaxID=1963 RepID=A0A250VDF5_STROL|nr:hypothetical protein SO3561_03711 [Streptomyces olivochromogenes]
MSCANEARATSPCHTSDTATNSEPPQTSTAAPAPAARAEAPKNSGEQRRTPAGITASNRRTRAGTGKPARPYVAHTPIPAALPASSGRHPAVHTHEGRNSPPEQYSAATSPTVR